MLYTAMVQNMESMPLFTQSVQNSRIY